MSEITVTDLALDDLHLKDVRLELRNPVMQGPYLTMEFALGVHDKDDFLVALDAHVRRERFTDIKVDLNQRMIAIGSERCGVEEGTLWHFQEIAYNLLQRFNSNPSALSPRAAVSAAVHRRSRSGSRRSASPRGRSATTRPRRP